MSLALKKSIIMRLIFDYELDKVAAIEVSSCAYLTSSVHDLEDCHGNSPRIHPGLWQFHLTSTVLLAEEELPDK